MKRKMKKRATFAYFSLTDSVKTTDYAKTEVTGQSGKIPTITLTNPNKKLYLKVSTTDMSQEHQETDYYAVDTCELESAPSCNLTSEKDHNVINIAVTGGDDDTTYECTGTISIKASGTMYDAVKDSHTGDLTLRLKNYSTDGGEDETIDLVTLAASEGSTTRNLKVDIKGNNSKDISASLKLNNSSEQQNYLAGTQLSLEIEAQSVTCDVKQAS